MAIYSCTSFTIIDDRDISGTWIDDRVALLIDLIGDTFRCRVRAIVDSHRTKEDGCTVDCGWMDGRLYL